MTSISKATMATMMTSSRDSSDDDSYTESSSEESIPQEEGEETPENGEKAIVISSGNECDGPRFDEEMRKKRQNKKKMETEEKIRRRTCKKCGHVSPTPSKMRLHYKTKHAPSKKTCRCHICEDKVYAAAYRLRDHLRSSHTEEKPHKCCWCGRGFLRPGRRNEHLDRCYKNPANINSDDVSDEDWTSSTSLVTRPLFTLFGRNTRKIEYYEHWEKDITFVTFCDFFLFNFLYIFLLGIVIKPKDIPKESLPLYIQFCVYHFFRIVYRS